MNSVRSPGSSHESRLVTPGVLTASARVGLDLGQGARGGLLGRCGPAY
jgi:hypothetical protein